MRNTNGNQSELGSDMFYCAAYDVLLMNSNVVVIPVFTSEIFGVNLKTGDLEEDVKPFENVILAGCFTDLKYVIMKLEFVDDNAESPDLYKGSFSLAYGTVTLLREAKLHLKKNKR